MRGRRQVVNRRRALVRRFRQQMNVKLDSAPRRCNSCAGSIEHWFGESAGVLDEKNAPGTVLLNSRADEHRVLIGGTGLA